MSIPIVPAANSVVQVVVLSAHRLVPMALRAAGRADGAYEVAGAATDADEAISLIEELKPDALVFDPTSVSLGRSFRLLKDAGLHLRHPLSIALLLEPAQPSTAISARFMWEAGVRCAMTSQEAPDIWPLAVMAAVRGATYVSPVAAELFGLPPSRCGAGIIDGLAQSLATSPRIHATRYFGA